MKPIRESADYLSRSSAKGCSLLAGRGATSRPPETSARRGSWPTFEDSARRNIIANIIKLCATDK